MVAPSMDGFVRFQRRRVYRRRTVEELEARQLNEYRTSQAASPERATEFINAWPKNNRRWLDAAQEWLDARIAADTKRGLDPPWLP